MKKVTVAALALCVPVLAFGQAPSRAADEAAIRQVQAAFAAALNKRDAAAYVAPFAADGDWIVMDGPRVVGNAAMRAEIAKTFAAWPKTLKFTLQTTSIRFITPDVALVEATATFSEGDVKANRGTSIMVRQNGKWVDAALRVFQMTAAK